MRRRNFIKTGLIFVPAYLAGKRLFGDVPPIGAFGSPPPAAPAGPTCATSRAAVTGATQTSPKCGDQVSDLYQAGNFTNIAASYTVCQATLRLSKSGTPTNISASIWTNNAGVPGSMIGIAVTVAGSAVGASEGDVVFSGFSVALNSSTQYHVVIKADVVDSNNYFVWAARSTSFKGSSSADGVTWSGGSNYQGKFTLFSS